MPRAVNEEARRAVHPALEATHEVAADLSLERMLPQRLAELGSRQAEALRRGEIELRPQGILVLIQRVVHPRTDHAHRQTRQSQPRSRLRDAFVSMGSCERRARASR